MENLYEFFQDLTSGLQYSSITLNQDTYGVKVWSPKVVRYNKDQADQITVLFAISRPKETGAFLDECDLQFQSH